MAKKKADAATSTAKKKTTTKKSTTIKKATAKKPATKKVVKKKDDIGDILAEGITTDLVNSDLGITANPHKDYYDISLEQINKYKESHNGEDPGLDLEEVKKDANAGFATIILDNDSVDLPEDVKATINFADQVMAQAEAE